MSIGGTLAAVAALLAFTVDRFEPPMAVLIDGSGQAVDVPLSRLPAGARPGDRLASPSGPIIGDRAARVAAVRARVRRLARLADEPPAPPADPAPAVDRRAE